MEKKILIQMDIKDLNKWKSINFLDKLNILNCQLSLILSINIIESKQYKQNWKWLYKLILSSLEKQANKNSQEKYKKAWRMTSASKQ